MPVPDALRPLVRRLAARVGPALPQRVQERVLQARAWVSGRAVGLPAFARVLALAPHPDDETLAFGGTLALLAASGATVTVVLVSDGESTLGSTLPREEVARARRAEAVAAGAVLGVSEVRALGHPDAALASVVAPLAEQVASLLRELAPQLVLLPWFLDGSDDHRAVNLALVGAAPGEDVEVWGGELWTPVPANRIVDISAVLERKRDAIAAHATAHGAFDISAVLGINRYRSLHGLRGQGHAEGFLTAPGPVYCGLVADALALDGGRITART